MQATGCLNKNDEQTSENNRGMQSHETEWETTQGMAIKNRLPSPPPLKKNQTQNKNKQLNTREIWSLTLPLQTHHLTRYDLQKKSGILSLPFHLK